MSPQDIHVTLHHRPGALAELGEALGAAGVSLEGGGDFVHDGVGVAHFLVDDGPAAARALGAAGLRVVAVREVITLRLRQGVPGQLGPVFCIWVGKKSMGNQVSSLGRTVTPSWGASVISQPRTPAQKRPRRSGSFASKQSPAR